MSITYDRTEILSLRLRAATNLRRLSRRELFSRLQLIRELEPIVDDAYKQVLRRRWRDQTHDSPHGHPWHVSFHASQFPGDDSMACARQALYRMMDLPAGDPPSRRLHMTAEAGKAIEVDLVTIFHEHGILISAAPHEDVQTGFVIPEVRLTGSVDSAIVMRRRPVPVEIKTKHESVIREMRLGRLGPDDSHVKQIKTQLGLVRAAQEAGELWSDLKLCDHGVIYYLPRDTKYTPQFPVETAEFRVDYDPVFYETGLEQLKRFRAYWDEEILPELKPGKRTTKFGHPNGWKWSKPPCQFCSYKKVCQLDFRGEVTDMSESHGIEEAKLIRPDYDYSEARNRVESRWEEDDE